MIVDVWKGSISASVACEYKNGKPTWDPEKFLKKNSKRDNIKLIPFDITDLKMVEYPINVLRNIAWDAATTPYVFLLDVDFVPSVDTWQNLMQDPLLNHYLDHQDDLPTPQLAYVVPAFNSYKKSQKIRDKTHLLDLKKKRDVVVFGDTNHAASNFLRWKTANRPFCTEPQLKHEYEPYMVLPWWATHYDERFEGYSKNKKSHCMELIFAGWSFVISHNTMVTHLPHPRSKSYQNSGKKINANNWKVSFDSMIGIKKFF